MRTIEAHGAKVEIPGRCECGSVCTDQIAADHVLELNRSGRPCSFCGETVKVNLFGMKHHHKAEKKDEAWSTDRWPEYEPHWHWMERGPHGFFEVHAHVACAKKSMPFANFLKTVYYDVTPILDDLMPKNIERGPCATCGAVPADEDVRRVASVAASFTGPCVYCGGPIKLLGLTLFHGACSGEHTGQWHFSTFDREAILHWNGYSMETKEYRSLSFPGHFRCGIRAMPYLCWLERNEGFIVQHTASAESPNP